MRLVTYTHNEQTGSGRTGVADAGNGREGRSGVGVRLPDGIAPIAGYATMLDLIAAGQSGLDAAARAADAPARLADATIAAPLRGSSKLLFSGVNFIAHILEHGGTPQVPTMPRFFAKLPNSVIGPGEPIVLPTPESQVDPEVEMALIIGRTARAVKRTEALSYVFGYTAVNDVGARDVQFQDNQEDRGKGYDTFTPMGPEIVLAGELPDPQQATLKLWVNGEERQSDTTARMHWSFAAMIESISAHITLYPGDIITSGTPAGIGHFRTPPVYLHHGDVVEVAVGGVGRLRNPVVAGW